MERRPINSTKLLTRSVIALACVMALCGAPAIARAAEWGQLDQMHNYHVCFGLDSTAKSFSWKITMLESSAPGNVFHEDEQPHFTFQIENLSGEPLKASGKIDVIRYAQSGLPGDQWWPELRRLEDAGSCPVAVDLSAGGWKNLTVAPRMPEIKGGYALIVDLGPLGRQYLTSAVRTFKPRDERVQYPRQALEEMPPAILNRLGFQAIRWGVAYIPSNSKRYAEHLEKLDLELKAMHENHVTVMAEIGASNEGQPLGMGRPHLDDKGVMQQGKTDLAWLPEYDDDYQRFIKLLAVKYGWPNGPITAFDLWNEPWEAGSISGWQADIPRYRELFRRMGEAVFAARKEAGVDVLVGGCDSSANTWDKLFPDGKNSFLPFLDFCSIHYQGLKAPVLYPEWNNRKDHKGRVLVWDTESWVANTDDRYAGVVASNRAAGYDRAMGSLSRVAISSLSHNRVAYDTIRTAAGNEKIERLIESRPLAAAYGAVQHFLGEREFREILFKNGLPWVYVFDGLGGNADDGTVVVIGDIDSLFSSKGQRGRTLFANVRSLDEANAKKQLREERARLPANDGARRQQILEQLTDLAPLTNASMTIDAAGDFGLYDYYGNPVPVQGGSRLAHRRHELDAGHGQVPPRGSRWFPRPGHLPVRTRV